MLPAPPSPPPPLSSRNTLHSLCYGQFDKNLPARSSTSVARDVGSGIKVALFVRQTIDPRSRWNSMYTDIRCKTRCIKYLNYAGPCCVPGVVVSLSAGAAPGELNVGGNLVRFNCYAIRLIIASLGFFFRACWILEKFIEKCCNVSFKFWPIIWLIGIVWLFESIEGKLVEKNVLKVLEKISLSVFLLQQRVWVQKEDDIYTHCKVTKCKINKINNAGKYIGEMYG